MKRVPLIDLGIWVGEINEVNPNQIASDIKNYAQTIEQESPDCGLISRGFVQFDDLVMPITPEIVKLEEAVKTRLLEVTGREYYIHDTWAVDLEYNQSVIAHSHHSNLHSHPQEYFSVTYYPQVPDGSAELVFNYDYCNMMSGTLGVKPQVGTCVIFNSFIQHMTSRNKSKDSRLVVSQNWGPTNPTEEPNADWSVYWDRPVISDPKPHGNEK
jgi:hypothetical protein